MDLKYKQMLPVGFPYKTIDGDYTFCGAIEEFFDNVQVGKPISEGWNEESTFEKKRWLRPFYVNLV